VVSEEELMGNLPKCMRGCRQTPSTSDWLVGQQPVPGFGGTSAWGLSGAGIPGWSEVEEMMPHTQKQPGLTPAPTEPPPLCG
jgi:hypothetical protein